ncbi:MAG: DNA alkylation repair protein [Albidovulum sp.]
MARHCAGFDAQGFVDHVVPAMEPLELKARAQLIADTLHAALPHSAAARAKTLHAVLHPDPLDHANKPSDHEGLCGWAVLPLTLLVGQHGVGDFDRSMGLLRDMTMRFSSEFGIRYFLLADQGKALTILGTWLNDPNRHVRRLISEGTRPRLPWAMQLPALMTDPTPVLPLLERLRDDPELYVRRSVANHMNDISKDHPTRVTTLAADWIKDADKDRMALLRHACRSLIKQGDAATLAAFGHNPPLLAPAEVSLSADRIQMGGAVDITMPLQSTASVPQLLTIDYVVHFRKANGRRVPKVFKGTTLTLAPHTTGLFRRSHPFRHVTTRKHYPGRHAVSLRINGQDTKLAEFILDL